eukprot:scaffold293402_cov14-Tisochrysis_lutea.AAC.2
MTTRLDVKSELKHKGKLRRHVGNFPYINLGKGEILAQKSRESHPPQGYRPEDADGTSYVEHNETMYRGNTYSSV